MIVPPWRKLYLQFRWSFSTSITNVEFWVEFPRPSKRRVSSKKQKLRRVGDLLRLGFDIIYTYNNETVFLIQLLRDNKFFRSDLVFVGTDRETRVHAQTKSKSFETRFTSIETAAYERNPGIVSWGGGGRRKIPRNVFSRFFLFFHFFFRFDKPPTTRTSRPTVVNTIRRSRITVFFILRGACNLTFRAKLLPNRANSFLFVCAFPSVAPRRVGRARGETRRQGSAHVSTWYGLHIRRETKNEWARE